MGIPSFTGIAMALAIGVDYRGIAWFSDYMGKEKIADCPSSAQKKEMSTTAWRRSGH
ncbi:hypothetical protein [Paenibacillus antibioticophila]|uniref:hypothetical protein n=1 Tax=Paenibacillus antibioticophila TaxID=1274374 RepID=UPI00130509C3|nr:hypothetical protein [Paenibacillus antibioticophila]